MREDRGRLPDGPQRKSSLLNIIHVDRDWTDTDPHCRLDCVGWAPTRPSVDLGAVGRPKVRRLHFEFGRKDGDQTRSVISMH